MVEVPDYSFISKDTGPSLSQSIGNWQGITKNALEIQKGQAQQELGQVYQQSIDENGRFDPLKFNALLATRPRAAMAAQSGVESSQKLQGEQLTVNTAVNNRINDAVTSVLQIQDPNQRHDELIRQAGRLIDSGMPRDRVMSTLLNLSSDPATLSQQLETIRTQTMPPQQRQDWIHGTRPTITTPQGTYMPVVPTPGRGPNVTVVTPHGPTPGGTVTTKVPVDEQGIIPLDANGNPTRTPKDYVDQPKPITAVPGVPQGGPPQLVPQGGGGGGAGGSSLPSGAPSPPAGTTLKGGRFVATPPPASTMPPAVPPAVPPATTQPPATTPPAGQPPVLTSAPARTTTEQEASQKQFIADRTVLPQRQTQEQNLQHAYEALRLVTSGRGTETASSLRNLLVTAGVAGAATANDEALYEIGRKYTERAIADAGNAGGTDTARAVAAASNPNVSLINAANLTFLRNDIGKVRQQMAAYMTAPDKNVGAGYGEHSANLASNTDYRGFNWDMYSPAEQKEIEKSVGAQGSKAHDALARAIGMGRALWPQRSGPGPIVPHAAVMPAGPPPNALAMAQPQGNPLLAA